MIKLRNYQVDLIARTRESISKNKRVIIQSATGSGKTAIACHMIGNAVASGKSCMFIVHQNELLTQTSKALWHNKIAHGMIVSGKSKTPHPVQLASVMTLINRLDSYPEPSLIIIDESHRAVAPSYQRVLEAYPNAYVVGLTATPQRTDGKGLDHIFNDITIGPSIRFLIEQGFLCDYELFGVPQKMNLSNVKNRAGDYARDDLEKEANRPSITGDAVEHYKKLADGLKTVVMCVSIAHAESVAAAYNDSGIKSKALHGGSTNREGILEEFESGDLMVLTSVQLLIEGVDLPVIACIQWLRPTQSIVVYMQGNGRGLRVHGSKDKLLILDHVGNYARHGLPCQPREWSLEGDKNKSGKASDEESIGVQVCEKCFFTFRTGVSECPNCGNIVPIKERKLEVIAGELERIELAAFEEAEKIARKKEQGKARELDDLVQVGIDRKMQRPDAWAANVFCSRQGRKPTKEDYSRARQVLNEKRN